MLVSVYVFVGMPTYSYCGKTRCGLLPSYCPPPNLLQWGVANNQPSIKLGLTGQDGPRGRKATEINIISNWMSKYCLPKRNTTVRIQNKVYRKL